MSAGYSHVTTQKQLLLDNLLDFYKKDHSAPLQKMMEVINGDSKISLRIVDWFVTNYAKKHYTVYEIPKNNQSSNTDTIRFKVFNEYKLRLKAYSKKNFDPFCRWERIQIPYDEHSSMETTIGQLNFFKWAIENRIIDYIQTHYKEIEDDMNSRNSTSKRKTATLSDETRATATRKKREELSISACKCIKKEDVKIVVKFN
jgi:hypothetical protein